VVIISPIQNYRNIATVSSENVKNHCLLFSAPIN